MEAPATVDERCPAEVTKINAFCSLAISQQSRPSCALTTRITQIRTQTTLGTRGKGDHSTPPPPQPLKTAHKIHTHANTKTNNGVLPFPTKPHLSSFEFLASPPEPPPRRGSSRSTTSYPVDPPPPASRAFLLVAPPMKTPTSVSSDSHPRPALSPPFLFHGSLDNSRPSSEKVRRFRT